MVQVLRQRSIVGNGFGFGVIAAALMAVAAIAGYEIGAAGGTSHAAAAGAPSAVATTCSVPQDAPPVTGYRP